MTTHDPSPKRWYAKVSIMLDRIGYQVRLDNSPFLRCLHNNNSSFTITALHHDSSSSYRFLPKNGFYIIAALVVTFLPYSSMTNKECIAKTNIRVIHGRHVRT